MNARERGDLADRLARAIRPLGADYVERRRFELRGVAHGAPAARECPSADCGYFSPYHARYCARCGRRMIPIARRRVMWGRSRADERPARLAGCWRQWTAHDERGRLADQDGVGVTHWPIPQDWYAQFVKSLLMIIATAAGVLLVAS